MSNIVNERDKLMRFAPLRVVPVQPVQESIIAGYTGIKMTSDAGTWGASNHPLYRIQPGSTGLVRQTLWIQFSGIATNTPITWHVGKVNTAWNSTKLDYDFISYEEQPVSEHGIILTPSPDPNVRTIEMTSYPRSLPFPGKYQVLNGAVFATCTWAAKEFVAWALIIQH
jgi:hypothetical protein